MHCFRPFSQSATNPPQWIHIPLLCLFVWFVFFLCCYLFATAFNLLAEAQRQIPNMGEKSTGRRFAWRVSNYLVYICLYINNIRILKKKKIYMLESTRYKKESKWRRIPEAANYGKISRLSQTPVAPICQKICKSRKFRTIQISVKIRGFVRKFHPIYLLIT